MKGEPTKFYLGLIDFFSIFLPGSMVTIALAHLNQVLSKLQVNEADNWLNVLLFFVASYLLGHVLFSLAAAMDERIYDPAKKLLNKDKSETHKKAHWLARFVARYFKGAFSRRAHQCLEVVVPIKKYYLEPILARDTPTQNTTDFINAYQWSRIRLAQESPECFSLVQRYEADSKFFRSMTLLFVFATCYFVGIGIVLVNDQLALILYVILAIMSLGFCYVCLYRYIELREKAIQQAYTAIIILESQSTNGYRANEN